MHNSKKSHDRRLVDIGCDAYDYLNGEWKWWHLGHIHGRWHHVFFSDPESSTTVEDALQCAHMAQAMQKRAAGLPIAVRIGINSGECTVGNFGSDDPLDYTISGPNLNVAARLEPNAEAGRILISAANYELGSDSVRCSRYRAIRVKGIDRKITTHWIEG